MVALARPVSVRCAFGLGVVTGVVYFTGTLYWITRVMVLYGGLQFRVALLVNAALVAYLALYPGIFAMVTGSGERDLAHHPGRASAYGAGRPACAIRQLFSIT